MAHLLSHAIALGWIAVSACVAGEVGCSHPPTDRVLEPSGGPGGGPSSPSSPSVSDAGVTPSPIATSVEPAEDFSAVRAPEFGLPAELRLVSRILGDIPGNGGNGGSGGDGASGTGAGGGIFR